MAPWSWTVRCLSVAERRDATRRGAPLEPRDPSEPWHPDDPTPRTRTPQAQRRASFPCRCTPHSRVTFSGHSTPRHNTFGSREAPVAEQNYSGTEKLNLSFAIYLFLCLSVSPRCVWLFAMDGRSGPTRAEPHA